jgi:hypothetical protein
MAISTNQDWNYWQKPPADPNAFNVNFHEPDPRRISGNLLKGLGAGLNQGMDFYTGEVLPAARNAQRGILKMSTQEGVNSKVSATRQALLSDAKKQSTLLRMRLEGQGGGIGTTQGADVSTFNAANQEANSLQSYYATPQGQYELYSVISQLQKNYPGLDVMQVLSQIFQQGEQINNAKPKGQGIGGLLSGIGSIAGLFGGPAGAAAGGGASALFNSFANGAANGNLTVYG